MGARIPRLDDTITFVEDAETANEHRVVKFASGEACALWWLMKHHGGGVGRRTEAVQVERQAFIALDRSAGWGVADGVGERVLAAHEVLEAVAA